MEARQYHWNEERIDKRFLELFDLSQYANLPPLKEERIRSSLYNYYVMRDVLEARKNPSPFNIKRCLYRKLNDLYMEMDSLVRDEGNLFVKPYIIAIIQEMAKFPYVFVKPTIELNLSNEELIDMIKLFFRNYRRSLYKEWLRLENREPDMIHMEEVAIPNSFFYPDIYNMIAYTLIDLDGTMSDPFALGHEMGHADMMKNNIHYTQGSKLTCEVIPYLIEHELALYLKKKNYYPDQVDIVELQTYYNAVIHAKLALYKYNFYNNVTAMGNMGYRKFLFQDTNPEVVKCALNSSFSFIDNVKYVCSYLIAQDIINLHAIRPDLALRVVNMMLNNKDNNNILDQLKKEGIELRLIKNTLQARPHIFTRP